MHTKATIEVLAASSVKLEIYEQSVELYTTDQMLLKNCQLSFYSPFISASCMSFHATKQILREGSCEALQTLKLISAEHTLS